MCVCGIVYVWCDVCGMVSVYSVYVCEYDKNVWCASVYVCVHVSVCVCVCVCVCFVERARLVQHIMSEVRDSHLAGPRMGLQ